MDTIAEEDEEEETMKPERTPASSGKRFMLSTLFATPTTLRYAAMADGEDKAEAAENQNQTNNSTGQAAESGTPSFLRRSNPAQYANAVTNGGLSPTAVRKPQPFVGKGLSTIVQGLRDMEEERMDDDMDVLREIEAEQEAAKVEVDDSQALVNEKPLRKKKGQKRTTRRVTMRPVVVPKPARQPKDDGGSDNDEREDTAVPETQQPGMAQEANLGGQFDDSDDAGSTHTMSEPDSDLDYIEEPEVSKPKTKSFSEKIKEAISSVAKPESKPQEKPQSRAAPKETEKENKQPRARKINPEAHANYRALNIRNKGTKGRFGRRFGRRN